MPTDRRAKLRRLLHDWLGWGYPSDHFGGDAFQVTYCCQFCDRPVTRDSQGNWFHLGGRHAH